MTKSPSQPHSDGFVEVRGARQNNLKGIDVTMPRNAFVVFTGISGSGKSSLAFGTIFAEAQRRYFESIAPYARRLIAQLPAPRVTEILGLPPAVALQQRRGEPTARSSVGTLTTLSNSLRMLFSRAGTYPEGAAGRLDSDAFSPNTHAGACPDCHGIGIVHTVSESSLVPDPNLSIREKAIASWPGAWQGKNYRDILATLGYDIDRPWKDLPRKDRDWILFTEEKPVVTVFAEREAHRIHRPYQGTYMSAASYVKHTFGTTSSAALRRRAESFMDKAPCARCRGKRLRSEALAVRFAGYDIAELYHAPLSRLKEILAGADELKSSQKAEVARLIVDDLVERIELLSRLGLDYLSMDRATPTLSAGELQRLRLATQLKSGLFGVVYVLDEPSAGLHPADCEALLETLGRLKDSGNSLFVIEHEMDLVRAADWIVDIGPGAGEGGGAMLYSGPVAGLAAAQQSVTRKYLFKDQANRVARRRETRSPSGWMTLSGVTMHNLIEVEARFPRAVLTVVTGVSGSGKSTLVSQVLADSVREKLGQISREEDDEASSSALKDQGEDDIAALDEAIRGVLLEGAEALSRLVVVDQKPIGRTPRSNLATYTGLFDFVRKAFAATAEARSRGFTASRFSFNVAGGRCTACEGEGFVSVELMFLPSVYAPCATCQGRRYNEETLAVTYRGLTVAQVLDMTVDSASEFFTEIPSVVRALSTLRQVGLGYLRLGQPATELSGGEAQRIRLAAELQREQRGDTLYILDEPTAGLHPADVEKLMSQLHGLVDAGNTVIVVEHDMEVISCADWIVDLGPGAGSEGGRIVASGTPAEVAKAGGSRTAHYLSRRL
ncbi:MAG: excinuclease ABC subunit UvrA [Candidatus Eremiobacteraeota bacterium]|nr:excinuclease ABC subunit UvrA [Candidatus Eremiobacteraeota bacterium]